MAAAVACRIPKRALLRVKNNVLVQQAETSTLRNLFTKKNSKLLKAALGSAVVGTIGVGTALFTSVSASLHGIKPPAFDWSHLGIFSSLDMASVRRGYEVYKQVCAACHSLDYMKYRYMAGTVMSPKKAAAEAAEVMVKDGPDESGNYFERPGKVTDAFPKPYENKAAAAAANNGAAPPDLSFICIAREYGEDYVFSLLTGYCDPPAGLHLEEGQYYNPYFAGGAIAMAPPLYNEIIEYEDGTPATKSQCAKDVITFLKWAGEGEYDERQKAGLKIMGICALLFATLYYLKRHRFSYLKTKKIVANPSKRVKK